MVGDARWVGAHDALQALEPFYASGSLGCSMTYWFFFIFVRSRIGIGGNEYRVAWLKVLQ